MSVLITKSRERLDISGQTQRLNARVLNALVEHGLGTFAQIPYQSEQLTLGTSLNIKLNNLRFGSSRAVPEIALAEIIVESICEFIRSEAPEGFAAYSMRLEESYSVHESHLSVRCTTNVTGPMIMPRSPVNGWLVVPTHASLDTLESYGYDVAGRPSYIAELIISALASIDLGETPVGYIFAAPRDDDVRHAVDVVRYLVHAKLVDEDIAQHIGFRVTGPDWPHMHDYFNLDAALRSSEYEHLKTPRVSQAFAL